MRAPEDAILDSHLLGQVSAITVAKARHGGGGFDTKEFLGYVTKFLGGSKVGLQEEVASDGGYVDSVDFDWAGFAREGLAWSQRAPMTDFM